MSRTICLILAISVVLAAPAFAARIQSTMITHFDQVYQACPGDSNGECTVFRGYEEDGEDVITAVPGILAIDPGVNWRNFVGAAQDEVPYTIKNVTLTKTCPEYVQCNGVFPTFPITQQGTPNIRLWWPLMYEVPSCEFKLTILYGTPVLYDDDADGPNPPAWVHVEQWVWHVDTDLERMKLLLALFHELPFGLDEVPLISDEPLYVELQDLLDQAIAAYAEFDTATAAAALLEFELEVMDAIIGVSPEFPNPSGPGTGIAQTEENPAVCKLLVDTEYVLITLGIGQPKK